MRQPQTPAEAKLWHHLRRRQLKGFYFRRQHPIERFIVDFYCAEVGLVVEVDGDVHAGQRGYDSARTEWLEERGYRVIRFTNSEIFHTLEVVLECIVTACEAQLSRNEEQNNEN